MLHPEPNAFLPMCMRTQKLTSEQDSPTQQLRGFIKLKLSNIEILLGFDIDNADDIVYTPLYYLLKDELKTWLELIYYTNKLFNEYLFVHNLSINTNFFTLHKFDTIIENGYTVIVPYFEEHTI